MSLSENAKRHVERVEPVIKNGIRYEELKAARSRGFGQSGGILVAYDNSTDEELWTLKIYTTTFDSQEETDVQEVYISKLNAHRFSNTLSVKNEQGQTFTVSIKEKSVSENQ